MYTLTMISIAGILLILVFICVRSLLDMLIRRSITRSRLNYRRHSRITQTFSFYLTHSRYRSIHSHLSDLLEALSFQIRIGSFMAMMALFLFMGILIGAFVFQSLKGVLILSVMMGLLPYMSLRIKVVNLQMKTRMDFLPAVEVYYEHYVMATNKNVISVLKVALQGNRVMYPLKPIFEHLLRNLTTHREVDDCLRIFTLALGHAWADYFVNILRISLTEGTDVTTGLKELITDMRKAQRANQVERNRLLEIRIANFASLFILLVFLAINFKINFHNAYHYYVVDAVGRNMLLDGVIFIFISFLMGVYLSVKRM